MSNPNEAKKGVVNYFKEIFKATKCFEPSLEGLNLKTISFTESMFFELPFSMEEMKEAVWSCDGNKVPGPDGFKLNFIKKFSDLLKFDILNCLESFSVSGILPNGIHSSFIAQIPKVSCPLKLKDFQPISLLSST